MSSARLPHLLLGLCLLALTGGASAAPQVRALLFYGPGCPACGDLFAFYLPGLHERYGARLEVAGIDLADPRGAALYRAAHKDLGLPDPWPGEPVMWVGGRVLVGLGAIGRDLGDGFEAFAREPASARWPRLPGLETLLEEGLSTVRARTAAAAAATQEIGSSAPARAHARGTKIAEALAWTVLAGMLLGLPLGLWWLRSTPAGPGPGAVWILAVFAVGLGVSAYTAYTSLAGVAPLCGPVGDCASVQASEYAHIFGVPMGVLGLTGYGLIGLAWLRARYGGRGGWLWFAWGLSIFGVLFSIRLTALEIFVIHATCIWCLASAVSMSALFLLLSRQAGALRVRPASPARGRPPGP